MVPLSREHQPFRVSFNGLHFEDPQQARWTYELSRPMFNCQMWRHSGIVSGTLPKDGPGLILLNHAKSTDVFVAHGLPIALAHRTLRLVARKALIDPRAEESQTRLARRTEQDVSGKRYSQLNPLQKLIRQMNAFYMRQFDTIPVDDLNPQAALDEILQELRMGHLVGMFFQGTRRPRFDLMDDQKGAARIIANELPNLGVRVPVYPGGISGTNKGIDHIEVNIGDPFYHDDITYEIGQHRVETARAFIRDKVGPLIVDPKLKPAWELNQMGMNLREIKQAARAGQDLNTLVSQMKAAT